MKIDNSRARTSRARALLWALTCAWAIPSPAAAEQPTASLSNRAEKAESIRHLPNTIIAARGQLTLYADFSQPHTDGVVVYLVNRTDRQIGFSCQDYDPYLKLETKSKSGDFERAEAHHYSTCGNSYFGVPSLRPGEFFRILGYQPHEGEAATVRFRLYSEFVYLLKDGRDENAICYLDQNIDKMPVHLVSNAGPGLAAANDIAMAKYDGMAVKFGDFNVVRDMATGAAKRSTPDARWSRNDAVEALSRFSTDDSATLLSSMLKNNGVREAAVQALARLGLTNPKAESIFQSLLQGEDVHLRAIAIASLARRPVTHATVAFGKVQLADKRPEIRTAAVSLLAQISPEFPEAKQAVMSHTQDPDPSVRQLVEGICKAWERTKKP